MSRARTVKPEWLEDELLSQCQDGVRIMSIALILMADDYGNGRVNKLQQATRVFPPPDESPEEFAKSCRRFSESLAKLAEIRFVGLYQINGQHYFTIRRWFDHQKVSHPGKPLVPGPPEGFWNYSRVAPEELESTSGTTPEELQKPSALIGSDLIRSDLIGSDPPYPPMGESGAAAETSVPVPEATPRPHAGHADVPITHGGVRHLGSDTRAERPGPIPPVSTRRERVRTEWSDLKIRELAIRCRENPHEASIAGPENRPEVLQVQRAWCEAVGLPIRALGSLSDKNHALNSILRALETYSLEDVLRACAQAKIDDWAQGRVPNRDGSPGKKCRLEWMSTTVLGRLLDAADERKPEIRSPRVQKAIDAVDSVLAGTYQRAGER